MNYQDILPITSLLGCLPAVPALLIASLVMSAAGTAASLVGQKQAADAQADYQQELSKSNVAAAQVQSAQVRDQQAQTNEGSGREAFQASLAAKKAASTATVAAGESGVTGNSVDALLRDYKSQEGIYKEALLRQKQLTDVSSNQQIDAIRAGADANNLSMNAPIAQPNYFAEALRFGAQASGAVYDYKRSNVKTTTKTG